MVIKALAASREINKLTRLDTASGDDFGKEAWDWIQENAR